MVEDLQEKVSVPFNKVEKMKNSIDKQEQFSKRNCLLLHDKGLKIKDYLDEISRKTKTYFDQLKLTIHIYIDR